MQQWLIILTLFLPLGGAFFSLVIRNNQYQRWWGVAVGVGTWLASAMLLHTAYTDGVQVYRLGGWIPPFGIVLVADMLAAFFVFMASSVMLGGLIYSLRCQDKSLLHPAFTTFFLCMECGLLGAFLTGDIFTLYVFVELMVVSSVSMVAISDNELGLEAAMKYVFISAMGSLFLLVGISTIYATFGTLNFADLAYVLNSGERPLLAQASAVMLMAAFLLKSAVFPFHFWQPDFHTTAPTPVSAMLSSVVVKVGIYGMLRITTLLFVDDAVIIRQWLVLLGLISIFYGSLSALRTSNGKRMLAYSTLGQVGFILLGIGWGTPLALIGALIYAFNHAFIKAAMLMLMGVIASTNTTKTIRLSEIIGLGKSLPLGIGVLYLLGGMALSGLPPMNGFISKLALIRGGIEAQAWIALVLGVGGGLLTLIYIMRTWQLIFQQKANDDTAALKTYGRVDSFLAPALLIAVCVVLGVYARPLYDTAAHTVAEITDNRIYIEAVNPYNGDASLVEVVE